MPESAGLLRADDSARTALQMARAQGISCLTDDPAGVVRMIGSDSPEAAIASYVRDHLAPIFCQESGRRRELLDTLECCLSASATSGDGPADAPALQHGCLSPASAVGHTSRRTARGRCKTGPANGAVSLQAEAGYLQAVIINRA